MILKIFLIVALIKLLTATDKPFLCSGIYAVGTLLFGLAFGYPFSVVLIAGLLGFVLASLYFWLLSRFEDSGMVWWLIMIGGLVIGLV